jgi:predicted nucleic acid-binding protein
LIVVDASVAVKWFLPEPGEAAAQAVLAGGEKLTAPALIRVEVAAGITRKARLGEIENRDAARAVSLWFRSLADGVVTLAPDEADLDEAAALALALRHPLQDCLYLALAVRLDARLVTADRRFAARAEKHYRQVQTLYV